MIIEVDILYEGDPWLSTSSLTAIAVFTEPESERVYLDDLLAKHIISDYGYSCLRGYYGDNCREAEIKDGKLQIQRIELNPKSVRV